MVHRDEETIVAQCTPQGKGAIALIRISGTHACAIADVCAKLASGKKLHDCATHTIHYGTVVDANGDDIDTVLFLLMRGPKTFTGHDTVEITCHNNQFIIQRIIARAMECGARHAQEGEFTRRSYLNGKLDLIQAEAINELINANNQYALNQSLSQVKGTLSAWIETVVQRLMQCIALSEASFEFIDEDMEFGTQIKDIIVQCRDDVARIMSTFDQQRQLREGIRVALVGSVNAGKSSLFNALLKQDRAIVTPLAGTTRDVIESGVYIDGHYWTLVDTAGLRQTDDIIEQHGIEKTYQQAARADIVIVVCDGSREMTDHERLIYDDIVTKYRDKVIVVHNKADLPPVTEFDDADLRVTTHDAAMVDRVHAAIKLRAAQLLSASQSPFLLNQRHMNSMKQLAVKLEGIEQMLDGVVAYELLSHHIQEALECVTELTGKTISERGMDMVFREFCVGK